MWTAIPITGIWSFVVLISINCNQWQIQEGASEARPRIQILSFSCNFSQDSPLIQGFRQGFRQTKKIIWLENVRMRASLFGETDWGFYLD